MIRARIKEIQAQWTELQKEVEELQEACPHPQYEEGLTIVACIQPVLICSTCGHTKPMPPFEGETVMMSSP